MKILLLIITVVAICFSTNSFAKDTIYEINTRQYSENGTFDDVYKDLNRLKNLGVTILWFMPISKIGVKNRKGSIGSPYSIQDYKSINPNLGTKSDFKKLVAKAHSLDMRVILDWVANHTAWDHHWTFSNPEFYNKNQFGDFIPPVADWNDVIDLDYSNPYLRQAMIDDMKYWIEEFDIDGFRCDVASMVPTSFWVEARKQLVVAKKNNKIFMLGESSERKLMESGAFDAIYADNLYYKFFGIIHGPSLPEVIHSVIHDRYRSTQSLSHIFMNFSTNHDRNHGSGALPNFVGKAEQPFIALTFLLPGIPLVFNGQESGLNKRLAFFEPDLLPEIKKDHSNYELVRILSNFRQSRKDILTNTNTSIYRAHYTDRYQDPDILIFSRESILMPDQNILVVMNLSNHFRSFKIYNPDSKISGRFRELISGQEFYIDVDSQLELEPWGFKILEKL